jgi:DNA-binding IclR family transcriptional regulator
MTVETGRTLHTVKKALRVLQALAVQPGDWGVVELARQLGEGSSVVHSILQTLVSGGFAEQDPRTKRYRLGTAILVLAQTMTGREDLRPVAKGPLQVLANATGECAYLLVPSGSSCITVDRAEPPGDLRVTTEIGSFCPLHAGSNPKAILAFMGESFIERYLAGPLEKVAPRTVTDPVAVAQELAQIRQCGYSYTEEELFEGIAGVAAPVFNGRGEVVGSVGIGGWVGRVRANRGEIIGRVQTASRAISASLGYIYRS